MTRKQIKEIISKAKEDISSAPEGSLRVVGRRGVVQYFHRQDRQDTNGRYLGKDELELARRLAQKEYAQKVLDAAEEQLKIVEKYIEKNDSAYLKRVWDDFNPIKKELVVPYEVSDEEFVARWKAVEYDGSYRPFDKNFDYYSRGGVRVRSSNEKLIADLLEENGIPFRYEYPYVYFGLDQWNCPIPVDIRPDFTVLNPRTRKEFVWEHFGMMERQRYRLQTYAKLRKYAENGLFLGENLIVTFSEDASELRADQVEVLIKKYLK